MSEVVTCEFDFWFEAARLESWGATLFIVPDDHPSLHPPKVKAVKNMAKKRVILDEKDLNQPVAKRPKKSVTSDRPLPASLPADVKRLEGAKQKHTVIVLTYQPSPADTPVGRRIAKGKTRQKPLPVPADTLHDEPISATGAPTLSPPPSSPQQAPDPDLIGVLHNIAAGLGSPIVPPADDVQHDVNGDAGGVAEQEDVEGAAETMEIDNVAGSNTALMRIPGLWFDPNCKCDATFVFGLDEADDSEVASGWVVESSALVRMPGLWFESGRMRDASLSLGLDEEDYNIVAGGPVAGRGVIARVKAGLFSGSVRTLASWKREIARRKARFPTQFLIAGFKGISRLVYKVVTRVMVPIIVVQQTIAINCYYLWLAELDAAATPCVVLI